MPEELKSLALPPLYLWDETVKEIENLAGLTRLKCNGSNSYLPTLDLIGLKVRNMCRLVLQGQLMSCYCDRKHYNTLRTVEKC